MAISNMKLYIYVFDIILEFNTVQYVCWDYFGEDDTRGTDYTLVKYFKDFARPKIPKCPSRAVRYFNIWPISQKNQSALLYPLSHLIKNRIANKNDQITLNRQIKIESNNDSVFDPSVELDYYSDVMIYVTIGLASIGIVIIVVIFIIIPAILLIKYRNRGIYYTNNKTWLDHVKIDKPPYKKVAIGEEIFV